MRDTKIKRKTKRAKLTFYEDDPSVVTLTFERFKKFKKRNRIGQEQPGGNVLYFDDDGKLIGMSLVNVKWAKDDF